VVFSWNDYGRVVLLAGTFDNWQGRIPLHGSEKDFSIIIDLPPGSYQYKFIVDNKWRHAPDQPTTVDQNGNTNNVVEVRELEKSLSAEAAASLLPSQPGAPGTSPPGVYTQDLPKEEYTKEPPVLPPHLHKALLDDSHLPEDPLALPLPHHVVVNHLYTRLISNAAPALPPGVVNGLATQGLEGGTIADDVLVLGATHRYQNKYITTVFYKSVSAPSPLGGTINSLPSPLSPSLSSSVQPLSPPAISTFSSATPAPGAAASTAATSSSADHVSA
jgi:5'-AMP-activated protein kinase regulatory beta subunit